MLRPTLLLFIAASLNQAFACWCVPPPAKNMRELAQGYASQPQVAAIFSAEVVKQEVRSGSVGIPGKAVSMTSAGQFRVVEFKVDETFRGTKRDRASLVTGLGGGDCGYPFETGRKYLVYASAASGDMLFTSLCSGTKELEDAGTDIRFLRNAAAIPDDLISPTEYYKRYQESIIPKRTGSICGTVTRPDGKPMKKAQVELSEIRTDNLPVRSFGDQNLSDEKGHFCIVYVEPGRYLLTAEDTDYDHDLRYISFYPSVASRSEASILTIEAGVKLPDVKLTAFVERLYSLDIYAVDPQGKPLSTKDRCMVTIESPYRDALAYNLNNPLQEGGTTGFSYIPRGEYTVSAHCYQSESIVDAMRAPEETWKSARQKIALEGDSTVILQMHLIQR